MNYDLMLQYEFYAAHRVYNELCPSDLHGHNFKLAIFLSSKETDSNGYIIDPEVVENSIIGNLNYSTILNKKDPIANKIKNLTKVIVLEENPTAEKIAEWVGSKIPNCSRVSCFECNAVESAWNRDDEEDEENERWNENGRDKEI